MTANTRLRPARLLAALGALCILTLSSIAGAVGAADCADDCRTSYGRFGDFASGGVTLFTQLGTQTIEAPRDTPARLALSTTGEVEVPVEFGCLEAYHLVVVKRGPLGGVVSDEWRYPACGTGVDVHAVPIGFDAGEFEFRLSWWSCLGGGGEDYRELLIVDPPLPLPSL